MNESLIYRYLSGATTSEDERKLWNWIKETPENEQHFYEIKALWNARKELSKPAAQKEEECSRGLQQLNEAIDKRAHARTSHKRMYMLWGGVAATIALLLVFHLQLFQGAPPEKWLTYINQHTDSVQVITLEDGTTVWLKEQAKLTYPEKFTGKNREVTLEGEAFFQVVSDPKHPFKVHAGSETIHVLGTSFSVNTGADHQATETILVKGAIEFQANNGALSTILHPGQQALYAKGSRVIEVKEVDANVLTSWRHGLISLSDVSIGTIIQCLQDTYEVTIQMDTLLLKNRRYNFSFKRTKNVMEALNQLTLMTGIPAKVK